MNSLAIFTCFLPLWLWACTEVQASRDGRIIGGDTAYAAQFPFAAAITVQTNNSRHFCGGTLIEREWILTAGQCAYGAIIFTIQLGSNNIRDDDPNRLTVATSEYFVHPGFNPLTLANDIALIKLRIPVEYTSYIRKVDMLGGHSIGPGTLLLVVGWGQTSEKNPDYSADLRWVEVAALSNAECIQTYGTQIVSNSTICAEGNYNEGFCYGDTGSALLQDIGRGYMMHSGVASFLSAKGCESTDPSGFTRTFEHVDWIKNVTGVI